MRKILVIALLNLALTVLLSLLFLNGFFSSWQNTLSDQLFLPKTPTSEIVLVNIDDSSIQSIGRWPWPRSVYADFLKQLNNIPAVIGIDISFSEPSNPLEDDALSKSIAATKNVVLPVEAQKLETHFSYSSASQLVFPLKEFSATATFGVVNFMTDSDGVIRTLPLRVLDTNKNAYSHFSVEVLKKYLENKPAKQQQNIQSFLDAQLEHSALWRIRFVNKPSSFTHYSFADVLNGKVNPEVFREKIVLIGATAKNLHDEQLTPVSHGVAMSGIELHANALQSLLEQQTLRIENESQTILTIFALAIFSTVFLSFLRIPAGAVFTATLFFAYLLYSFIQFDRGTIVNLIFPPLIIVITYIGNLLTKYVFVNRQKKFVSKALSLYVSRQVITEMVKNPKLLSLGGQRREMTVLFSDIANFTTISEKLDPELLVSLLNEYLTAMTNIVFEHQGVLDKYIGDAVMAFWGAPLPNQRHAQSACETAIAMQHAISKLQPKWQAHGVKLEVRIGIHTGDMVVGNFGSQLRFDYTVVGDNVNLGSRLEGLNKMYGTQIIMSEQTRAQVKDSVNTRCLDVVAVKGKSKGTKIYELLDETPPAYFADVEHARTQYEKGDFKHALSAFRHLLKTHKEDKLIHMYVERCSQLLKNPVDNWNGVYHAMSK